MWAMCYSNSIVIDNNNMDYVTMKHLNRQLTLYVTQDLKCKHPSKTYNCNIIE